MTLKSLLRDIKDTIKILHAVDNALLIHEDRERWQLIKELPTPKPKQAFPELFRMSPVRSLFNAILADLSSASALVGLYGTVLSGQALPFNVMDHYTTAVDKDAKAALTAFFNTHTNGMSGLEGMLRETGDEEVIDEEVFATYRAMGCQTFSMWEISVHRIVAGTCAEAEKLAREMSIQVEKVLARKAKKE